MNLKLVGGKSNSNGNLPSFRTDSTQGLLTATPASLNFGNVEMGSSASQLLALNNTGGSTLSITSGAIAGTGFSVYGRGHGLPIVLAAGQSLTVTVRFSPKLTGDASGNISLVDDGSDPNLNVPISGTGYQPGAPGVLSAAPSSLNFGSVAVGGSITLTESLTNTGGTDVTISQANVTGSGFTISGLALPLTLTAGQSFTFSVTFAPTGAGAASGSIAVISDASNPTLTIGLSGTATAAGQLSVSPGTFDFGSVMVGQNKVLTGTLTASGAAVTLSSSSVGNSAFVLGGLTFPLTIPSGQTASFTVTFTPSGSGMVNSSVSFSSDASNSPTTATLTGVCTTQHTVDLSWQASPSNVVGYNVFRGDRSGGPYAQINSAVDPMVSYTDSSVQAGQAYYYVTTAVDSSGTQSDYSNEAQAVIPQ